MKKRLLYTSIVVLAIVFSCDYKKGLLPKKTVPLQANACDSIKYNNSIKAIIDNQCGCCHGACGPPSGAVDLTTYSNVLTKVVDGRIKNRITNTNNPMPPSGLLPQARIDSIVCWLDKGGPQ